MPPASAPRAISTGASVIGAGAQSETRATSAIATEDFGRGPGHRQRLRPRMAANFARWRQQLWHGQPRQRLARIRIRQCADHRPTARPQQYGGTQHVRPGPPGRLRQWAASLRGPPASLRRQLRPSVLRLASGVYGRSLQNYGMRPGFGGSNSRPIVRPATAPEPATGPTDPQVIRGLATAALAPTVVPVRTADPTLRALRRAVDSTFGGGRGSSAYSYGGGGSYKAPRAPSFGGRAAAVPSWRRRRRIQAPKAPHFSSGGGSHFGGGGSHFGRGGTL